MKVLWVAILIIFIAFLTGVAFYLFVSNLEKEKNEMGRIQTENASISPSREEMR